MLTSSNLALNSLFYFLSFLTPLIGVLFKDFVEDVLEPAVVLLEDGVLGAEVQRELLVERHVEAALGKAHDRLVRVVHGHAHTGRLVVEHVDPDGLAVGIRGCKHELELAGRGHDDLGRLVLFFFSSFYKARNV